MNKFSQLRSFNPNVKLLVGLGGSEQGRDTFHLLGNLATSRSYYINNVRDLVNVYGLDGIDFDWQYPGIQDDWIEADKVFYVEYLRDFRNALGSGKIISISVASKDEDISRSYNIPEIVPIVDFINLKTYNLRGASNGDFSETAFHSPLRPGSSQTPPQSEWNVESIVENWKNQAGGANIDGKLIIGISTFGRSFTLENAANNGIGVPASGIGRGGTVLPGYNDFKGILAYREICNGLSRIDSGWEENWDNVQRSSFATFDNDQWVGYDSIRSSVGKIVYARDNTVVGGVNYIRLELEDWSKLKSK